MVPSGRRRVRRTGSCVGARRFMWTQATDEVYEEEAAAKVSCVGHGSSGGPRCMAKEANSGQGSLHMGIKVQEVPG